MPAVEDFYNSLIKDPDLEIGDGKTREEAATIEAEYRARQYSNNVQALSLATEPLKAETGIKSLLNYVANISKTVMTGGLSIIQDILKAHTSYSNFNAATDDHKGSNAEKTEHSNYDKKQLKSFGPKGNALIDKLKEAGAPSNVVAAFVKNTLAAYDKSELAKDAWTTEGVQYLTDSENWVSFGGTPKQLKATHASLHKDYSHILKEPGFTEQEKATISQTNKKSGVYGDLQDNNLLEAATVDKVNKALAATASPYKIAGGDTGKIKLINADGSDIDANKIANNYPNKSPRLYSSMLDHRTPKHSETGQDTLFIDSEQEDHSQNMMNHTVASILNGIHWLSAQETPEQAQGTANKMADNTAEFAEAEEKAQAALAQMPPIPSPEPKPSKSMKDMPHRVFGGKVGSTHSFSEGVIQGQQYGLCDSSGSLNQVGMALLADFYATNGDAAFGKNAFHAKDEDGNAIARVLTPSAIQNLLDHHQISNKVMSHKLAESLVGEAFDAEKPFTSWDEYNDIVDNAVSDIPIDGIPALTQNEIDSLAQENNIDPEPKNGYGENPTQYHVNKIKEAAIKLGQVHHALPDGPAKDGILEKLSGELNATIEEAKLAEMDEVNPTSFSGLYGDDEIQDAITSNINDQYHAAVFKTMGNTGGTYASAVGDNGLAAVEEAKASSTTADAESWKNKLGELAERYAQSEGSEKKFALEGLHNFMKAAALAEDTPLTNQEINAAVASKLGADTSQVNFLEGGFPGTPATEPDKPKEVMPETLTDSIEKWANIKAEQPDSAAQEAAADKLTAEINNAKDAGIDVDSIYDHLVDMGGSENAKTYSDSWPEGESPFDSPVSETGVQAQLKTIKQKILENATQAYGNNIAFGSTPKAEQEALDKLHEAMGAAKDSHTNKEINKIVSDALGPTESNANVNYLNEETTSTSSDGEAVNTASEKLEEAISDWKEITGSQALDSQEMEQENNTLKNVATEAKDAGVPDTEVKELFEAAGNQTKNFHAENIETESSQEEAPSVAEEEAPAVVPDTAISDLMDKHSDVLEHMYEQTYGKDNAVMSLEDFKADKAEEYEKIGAKKAKHEIAVGHNKMTATQEKQETKEAANAAKQQAAEDASAKKEDEASEKQTEKQAATDEKEAKAVANNLPTKVDDLKLDGEGNPTNKIDDDEATHHLRQLVAHQFQNKDHMTDATKQKLEMQIENALNHGGDLDKIMSELKEHGDGFGSSEHLKQAMQEHTEARQAQAAHDDLVSGETSESKQTLKDAFDSGQADKFTEYHPSDHEEQFRGKPIHDVHLKPNDKGAVKGMDDHTPSVHGKGPEGKKFNTDTGHAIPDHHSLKPMGKVAKQQLKEYHNAKASGDEAGAAKALKNLDDLGIDTKAIENPDDTPKIGLAE